VHAWTTKKPLDYDGNPHHVALELGLTFLLGGWWFSVAVTRWSRSTQLLYIEPG